MIFCPVSTLFEMKSNVSGNNKDSIARLSVYLFCFCCGSNLLFNLLWSLEYSPSVCHFRFWMNLFGKLAENFYKHIPNDSPNLWFLTLSLFSVRLDPKIYASNCVLMGKLYLPWSTENKKNSTKRKQLFICCTAHLTDWSLTNHCTHSQVSRHFCLHLAFGISIIFLFCRLLW